MGCPALLKHLCAASFSRSNYFCVAGVSGLASFPLPRSGVRDSAYCEVCGKLLTA